MLQEIKHNPGGWQPPGTGWRELPRCPLILHYIIDLPRIIASCSLVSGQFSGMPLASSCLFLELTGHPS